MSLNAATIEILVRKHGFTAEDILEFARASESTSDSTNAERQARYRARMDVSADEWLRLRAEVFERDSYTCVYCGYQGQDVVCDHKTPLIQNGRSTLDNLVTACKPCNSAKGGRTPEEWLG